MISKKSIRVFNQLFNLKNLPDSKRSQIKIQEMAFMIVAVVLFFALAGLFLFSIFYVNMVKEANSLREFKTLSSVVNLANSPEFSCVDLRTNCVDEDKLINLVDRKTYRNFWQFSSLRVIKSSAFNKTESEIIKCNLGNYPNCDEFVIYDKKVKNERLIQSHVALCRTEYEIDYYDKCEIGKLIAGTEVIS
ncbi:MAG: hypothetical protein PHF67_02585 [Candidatus Nanoarchaeia archaeon]|nr:hypothetical protein [Candidatus Nanoarchaeia archaeon]